MSAGNAQLSVLKKNFYLQDLKKKRTDMHVMRAGNCMTPVMLSIFRFVLCASRLKLVLEK